MYNKPNIVWLGQDELDEDERQLKHNHSFSFASLCRMSMFPALEHFCVVVVFVDIQDNVGLQVALETI